MSSVHHAADFDQIDLDVSADDLRWHAEQSEDWHDLDAPTPDDALDEPADHDDEGPWWETMPESPELDGYRWHMMIAGGAGSYPARRRSSGTDFDQCDRPGFYT